MVKMMWVAMILELMSVAMIRELMSNSMTVGSWVFVFVSMG